MQDYQLYSTQPYQSPRPKKQIPVIFRIAGLIAGVGALAITSLLVIGTAPSEFPVNQTITIAQNTSIERAGIILEQENVIRSNTLFEFLITFFFANRPIIAGDYQFSQKKDILQVIYALTRGTFGQSEVRVTFPEGVSTKEIADILVTKIPNFNTELFLEKTKDLEGFLFPDTYLFFQSVTPDQVITRMQSRYNQQIEKFANTIDQSGKTEREIIIMASLLEKEARNSDEAKIVSGILWKRIDIKMPLQVDAPFLYTLGKTSAQLTRADLERDGPYNTYTHQGLPVGPIGNPGSAMIRAALQPQSSPYLFYLHDTRGKIYYARNHDEHVANKQKYLR
jgi:UPF0755 protein